MTNTLRMRARKADFSGTCLYGMDLSGGTYANCIFNRVTLCSCILTRTLFYECQFREAMLMGNRFEGARLTDCDFEGARLTSANLTGANVKGSSFRGADLRGTALDGFEHVGASFTQTCLDPDAVLPPLPATIPFERVGGKLVGYVQSLEAGTHVAPLFSTDSACLEHPGIRVFTSRQVGTYQELLNDIKPCSIDSSDLLRVGTSSWRARKVAVWPAA